MRSSWYGRSSAIAFLLLLAAATRLEAQRLPWKHGDKPPTLAGFELGEATAAARNRLGDGVEVDGIALSSDLAFAFRSTKRGISLLTSHLNRVVGISVTQRDAGVLDSIRVGDSRERVLARWGKPTRVRFGRILMWRVDDWGIMVQLGDRNQIVELGVGRQR